MLSGCFKNNAFASLSLPQLVLRTYANQTVSNFNTKISRGTTGSTSYFKTTTSLTFFLLKIVILIHFNNNRLPRKVTSLLCDAVDGHLVKVTSHFRLSDEAISGRHQGLFCPNLLSAGEISWVPKKKHKKWERIWESWVQVYKSTPTVLDDACNIVQSQFWCFFSHKPATNGNLDTPPANIPWVSPAFHSGPSRFRLKEYWIADSEFKVKHAIKTCGNSASPTCKHYTVMTRRENEEHDDKDKLQRAGIWDQTNYKTKWAETPLSFSDFQEPLRRLQNLAIFVKDIARNKAGYSKWLNRLPKACKMRHKSVPIKVDICYQIPSTSLTCPSSTRVFLYLPHDFNFNNTSSTDSDSKDHTRPHWLQCSCSWPFHLPLN